MIVCCHWFATMSGKTFTNLLNKLKLLLLPFSKKESYTLVLINVLNFIPFRSEWPKFLIPTCKSERKYSQFHLKFNFTPFRLISSIPDNFGKFWPKFIVRPKWDLAFSNESNLSMPFLFVSALLIIWSLSHFGTKDMKKKRQKKMVRRRRRESSCYRKMITSKSMKE